MSNVAGTKPLAVAGVHVARSGAAGSAEIEPDSDREILFAGKPGVTVPAGGESVSDPVDLPVSPLACLSVSMRFLTPPMPQTGHLRALSSTWVAHGDQLGAPSLAGATEVRHWYQLASVQVEAPDAKLIVAFGDSVTDGSGSTANANNRWPDRLAERLQAIPGIGRWAVANEGIAGNRVLAYGYGPSGLSRFGHDALAQPHLHTVILLEAGNDIGQLGLATQQGAPHRALVSRITAAYARLIAQAHARRVRIVGGTMWPFGGSDYHPTALDDETRRAINAWIKAPGHFDAVIDWDAAMRDPGDPTRLNPAFDSGDHIHPSPAGYRAMVDAIRIAELVR